MHLVAVLAVALVGCREQPTTVEGMVTLDGKPLSMHDGMRGTVVFQPTANEGVTLSGLIDAQGRYELAAGGSAVVPPKAYWVTVSAMEIVPPSEERPQSSGRLITPAKYASATDSGFRIEVQPGPNQVNLAMTSTESSTEAATGESAGDSSAGAAPGEKVLDDELKAEASAAPPN